MRLFLVFVLHVVLSSFFLYAQSENKAVITAPASYPPHLLELVKKAHRQICGELDCKLGFSLPCSASIVICADHEEMEQLAGRAIPPWALGIAMPWRYTVGIDSSRIDMIANNLLAVIRHEMCHLYLGVWERTYEKKLPLWFNEGLCEWFSGSLHVDSASEIADSAAAGEMIPLAAIEESFPENSERATQAYRQSLSVVDYIVCNWGEEAIGKILDNYAVLADFSSALEKTLGFSLPVLEKRWKKSVTPKYPWLWKIGRYFSLFSILAFGVIVAYFKQRRRSKKILQRLEREDKEWERYWV